MQLNNDKGNIILIIDINKETGRTVYRLFENIIYNVNGVVKEFLTTEKVKVFAIDYSVPTTITLQDEIEKQIVNQIISLENDNYTISDNIQNWIFPERPIRIILDNSESMRSFNLDANYRALMNGIVAKHEGFILVNKDNSNVYVNSLDDTEMAIVQPYIYNPETNPQGWIYIENKI